MTENRSHPGSVSNLSTLADRDFMSAEGERFGVEPMNAYQAAEQMQTAFCNREFANVSHVIGADWASGKNFKTPADYMRAAYEIADQKFGPLPFRYEADLA